MLYNMSIYITYSYLKGCKWKIRTKMIEQIELDYYKSKYRVLFISNVIVAGNENGTKVSFSSNTKGVY
jgi:hypothetical protein